MIAAPPSIDNKTTKVKMSREDGFYVFFAFLLLGCYGGSFFINAFIKFIKFFIIKNLIIIYKLCTIQSFYYKERDFVTS
jgi:hypothetical protein